MSDAVTKTGDTDVSPLSDLFTQYVVPGSSKYWATHFSQGVTKEAAQAIFCFAHLMDELAVASDEVIREKSVWWHDELHRLSEHDARHPVLKALVGQHQELLAPVLHEHLHGALMTQQNNSIQDIESWHQYTQMRIGSLYKSLFLVSVGNPAEAEVLANWAGEFTMLATLRVPEFFSDGRWLHPDTATGEAILAASLNDQIEALINTRPTPQSAACEVLIAHENRWWQHRARESSPLYSNKTLGLRGMLASWRTVRAIAKT